MKAQEHGTRRYKMNSMSLHSRTHLPHLHVLKTSSHWDSPPVEESHSKPVLLHSTHPHPSSEAMLQIRLIKIMPVAYSDQNQGHRPNHPKHGQIQSPSAKTSVPNWDPQSPNHPYQHHSRVRSQSVTIYGSLTQLSQ